MRSIATRLVATTLVMLLAATLSWAGTLSGTVINRTTGKPAPGVDLTCFSPTRRMADLGSAKSDGHGQFIFTNDAIGTTPILVRATYHDVSFNTFAPPGRHKIDVEIFDLSNDPKTISVGSHIIIFQPTGNGRLRGAEEYFVSNVSIPVSAYFRREGNFDFALPENATLGQVATVAPSGLPVPQAPTDKGQGRFSIAHPFRPGQTTVRVSYELPYVNNSAVVKLPTSYPGVQLLVAVPPGITVSGDGLKAVGQEQGMTVYMHDPLAADGVLSINLSGGGSPQALAGRSQGQQGTAESKSRPLGQGANANRSRMGSLKWYLLAGIAALLVLGAVFLSRHRVVVAASNDVAPQSESASPAVFAASSAQPQSDMPANTTEAPRILD
jgi:hypothetical protein